MRNLKRAEKCYRNYRLATTGIFLAIWVGIVSPILSQETSHRVVPKLEQGQPEAGRRVSQQIEKYVGTEVYHSLYLPKKWSPEKKWPVIVEFTGNFYPAAGSTGEVKDANLGYGLGREGYIWVVLPYVRLDGKANEKTWWGDEKRTIEYCKIAIPEICQKFQGDSENIYLCGFSRGAIGVNYIGLADDEIAKIWAGFISHDHYDGVREWGGTTWGSPLDEYRRGARTRFERIRGRPVLIMQAPNCDSIRDFLGETANRDNFTFIDVPVTKIIKDVPNAFVPHEHTDKWLLYDSQTTEQVHNWLRENRRRTQ